MSIPKVLSVKEASEMLRMHPITLKNKARAGVIPGGKCGKNWVFLDVDLVEYIRAQYKSPKKENHIDIPACHSISVKTPRTGGLKSTTTEEQYTKALGLKTVKKPKNITTN